MGAIAPVVYELWAVKVEKNGDFLHFFHFAQKWSNLWDNLATQKVANLMKNIIASFGKMMGSIASVV